MNASRYIGRVGGLAVALGVGAAAVSAAVASADSDTSARSASSEAGGVVNSKTTKIGAIKMNVLQIIV